MMTQSKVLEDTGQQTEAFIELLALLQPHSQVMVEMLTYWLKLNECNCLDYKLAFAEMVDDLFTIAAQSAWMECGEFGAKFIERLPKEKLNDT